MTEDAVAHSFWTPYVPAGLTAAQMHLGFCIAMKLIDGEVFVDQMVEENAARPDLVEFSRRVNVLRSPEREQKGRAFARGADVEVVLKNGTTLTKTVDNFIGSYQRPMSDEQMAAKFRLLAAKALPADAVERLERSVWTLERMPSVRELVGILQARA
jgi:2-methylcitrate dehydratase PrpD